MPQSLTQNSRKNFLKICFPEDKWGGQNYDFFCQNSVKNYEDDLEHCLRPWQFDTETTSEQIATLMKGGFLEVDSKLGV